MTDKVFEAFLQKQFDEGRELARNSDILELTPLAGDPPRHYVAEFNCKGLVQDKAGQIVEFDQFVVGIWLPEDYLRRVHVGMVLSYLGPSPRPWHPNLSPPAICLEIRPGTPLVDLLYGCYELWTWHLYNPGHDGFAPAAAQWARQQDSSRFPVDRRPLKRRTLKFDVTHSEKTEGQA